MKLYFYCAMKKFSGSKLRLKSIDNQNVIYIHSNDLYAAVSYTKYTSFDESEENRHAHEKIIKSISKHTNVLPFAFNTIVGETMGKGVLNSYYKNLVDALDYLGGKEEFVVRVSKTASKEKVDLLKIKAGINNIIKTSGHHIDVRAHKLAARIHGELIKNAADSIYEIATANGNTLDAQYLVTKKEVPAFKKSLKWSMSLYSNLTFTVKGPQPPYHFNPVNIITGNNKLLGKKYR